MASTMQLEFAQAMLDFKTMFPDMDSDVIEAVLRANQGAVDATIDQLLAMSTDNQNEKLRNEMDSTASPQQSLIDLHDDVNDGPGNVRIPPEVNDSVDDVATGVDTMHLVNTCETTTTPAVVNSNANLINLGAATVSPHHNTGASPKQRPPGAKVPLQSQNTNNLNNPKPPRSSNSRRWSPPVLAPLPSSFLRLQTGPGGIDTLRDYEMPDEQFALMLQNEEFMNELRWNQDFMTALEREQYGKSKGEDDADFKERLKNMGKLSRKKFLQMARVFTWQRNKKANTAKQIDSLPLKEEPSDDEDHNNHQQKLQPQQQQQNQSQQVRK